LVWCYEVNDDNIHMISYHTIPSHHNRMLRLITKARKKRSRSQTKEDFVIFDVVNVWCFIILCSSWRWISSSQLTALRIQTNVWETLYTIPFYRIISHHIILFYSMLYYDIISLPFYLLQHAFYTDGLNKIYRQHNPPQYVLQFEN